jgi:gentisate 1,2-dioxygenase
MPSGARRWMPGEVGEVDPHVGHALEFTNPADGGSIMPTIAAHVRLIPAGFETRARSSRRHDLRRLEGCGTVIVGEKRLPCPRATPSSCPRGRRCACRPCNDLVLFAYSDKAAQEKLNLYREWNS